MFVALPSVVDPEPSKCDVDLCVEVKDKFSSSSELLSTETKIQSQNFRSMHESTAYRTKGRAVMPFLSLSHQNHHQLK